MDNNNGTRTIELIICLIVLVVVLDALFIIPVALTNWIIQWLISALMVSIFSFSAGVIVEAFTGDRLKTITLTIEIGEFNLSIEAFAMATFSVKVWLFGF